MPKEKKISPTRLTGKILFCPATGDLGRAVRPLPAIEGDVRLQLADGSEKVLNKSYIIPATAQQIQEFEGKEVRSKRR